MIDGVGIVPLKRISDERGTVFHMLKRTDPHFKEFGEIYFSSIYPGVVKAWHLHDRMTLNYACLVGDIKLVLFDERQDSKTRGETQVLYLGTRSYVLVTVPPGVWNGFMNVGTEEAFVANCATIPHDPAEIRRLDPHKNHIPYDWARKNG
jgi:dTDP-4-dehydrorhamnose 3,5-epimerase